MVSTRTLQLCGRVLNLGSRIKMFPAKWNSSTNQIDLISTKCTLNTPCMLLRSTDFIPILFTLHEVVHVWYLLIFLMVEEYSNLDMCCAVFLLVCLYMTIFAQGICIIHFKSLSALANAYFKLDLQLRKFYFYFGPKWYHRVH